MRWSIAFVTMDRPTAAQRFVRSARRVFPDVPIYVADQSAVPGPMLEFYAAERVTVLPMPFDAGLSASRNALVDAMDVDYFALCDDDFVLGPATSFASAAEVLEEDRGLGVVGGMLHELDRSGERIRNWEMFFDHDDHHGRFTATPIYNYPALARRVAGRTIYACDAVLNFAMFRMAMFADGLRWDARIKINGEHEDFYLALKKRSHYGVAYFPGMAALHQPVQGHGRYATLRSRGEGRRAFMDKWGLTSHVEIGTGGRPLDGTPAQDWFVTGEGTSGTSSRSVAAGIAQMALYTTLEPDTGAGDAAGPEYRSFLGWLPNEATAGSSIPVGQILFRHRPAIHPEGGLLLWHRAEDSSRLRSLGVGDRDLVLRWFSPDGNVLVWESEVHTVHAAEDRYWQPLVARIPVWPRGAAYLRFDLVCAEGLRTPLAMGFVFPDREADSSPDIEETAAVLAWVRSSVTSEVSLTREPLSTLLARAPRTPVEVTRRGGRTWGTMDVSTVDAVGIMSSGPGAPPVWLARGARGLSASPVGLALPLAVARDPGTVLFAIDRGDAVNPLRLLDLRVIDEPALGP